MNTDQKITRPRLAAVNRQQMVMRTMDVELLIEGDHPARSIWELVGRLDLSRYYAEIGSREKVPGTFFSTCSPRCIFKVFLQSFASDTEPPDPHIGTGNGDAA